MVFSKIKEISFFALFSILILSLSVWAINTVATGYQTTTTDSIISAHGTCKGVRHTGITSVFVPTKTSLEWESFRDNLPDDVDMKECFTAIFFSHVMDTDLSTVDASFIGEVSSDNSGWSVSSAGDVNGDGYDDILIGARYNDGGGSNSGQSYLILGKSSGWVMDQDLSTANASFIGEEIDDYAGYSASSAGDVNGDGYDDILIGARQNDDGGSNSGQVYLIFGKSSGWVMDQDLSTADASFIGEIGGDQAGWSVSGAGDVNGDGYDDILIGSPLNDAGGDKSGQIYLVFGKSSGWVMDQNLSTADASFIGEEIDDRSGRSVSSAGDVNGDGYDDILIGSRNNDAGGADSGQSYLILGKSSGWVMDQDLSTADASFIGEDAGDQSGDVVDGISGIGDVNGDGYDDILIGAPLNDAGGADSGQSYLILGKSSGWVMDQDLSTADASFIGEIADDQSGWDVSLVGDINRDSYDDILIGARYNDEGGGSSGQSYLILGKNSGWAMDQDLSTADASFHGEVAGDLSGYSIGGADVNGDGYDDILVGSYNNDAGGSNSGQVYLILGGDYVTVIDLVYEQHDSSQCTSLGGTVVSSGSNDFCRFDQATCPAGWTQYNSWTTGVANTCGGGYSGSCLSFTCTTSSKSWSNSGLPTCGWNYRYEGPEKCESQPRTCTATVTQIGCY